MSDASARRAAQDLFPELLLGLRELEGRFPTNEVAARVVRAAMAQPGISGARLWRTDGGVAEVWTEAGTQPAVTDGGTPSEFPLASAAADPSIWTGPLGSDEFRARFLEARGTAPLSEPVRAQ